MRVLQTTTSSAPAHHHSYIIIGRKGEALHNDRVGRCALWSCHGVLVQVEMEGKHLAIVLPVSQNSKPWLVMSGG